MLKGFEPPVELDISARATTRCILVLTHAAALLPVFSLSWQGTTLILLLLGGSLYGHFLHLNRRRWQRLLLQAGGKLMVMDDSSERTAVSLLGCRLVTSQISILVVRIANQTLNMPVYRLGQPDAYRQLRRFLLKYPGSETMTVSTAGDKFMPNGHRRSPGSVF